jgi:hypothetical protein
LTPDRDPGSRFTSKVNMDEPTSAPTPVKVINSAVLSCIDDMFYRLPFPNSIDLEKLMKDSRCEAQMIEFRKGLNEDLEGPDAIRDFEGGWGKYSRETKPNKARAAEGSSQSMSFKDKNRDSDSDTGEGGTGG